jgi:predicted esterase
MNMVRRVGLAIVALLGVLSSGSLEPADAQLTEELTRAYLWPSSESEFKDASARIAEDESLLGVTRQQMHDLEEWMRRGPIPLGGSPEARGDVLDEFVVSAPGGREIPVFVRIPNRYDPLHQWPVMFAMHGGPPGNAEGAIGSARRMIDVWAESAEVAGWIVVSPAMVDAVSRDGRTQDRLPYEVFHPEEARAVLDAVRTRYSVNTDRIVSTGISLGSNFSIAYGAGHPDWLSAIVPVSTEGDSRELLLRNLAPVSTYVLEGSQDQNIRGVSGPRSLEEILTSFNYDLVYREFSDRAHEGFQEHYPDVLRWLESRPRQVSPREVLRVPHKGIVPTSRRVHWVEADTRQAFVHARVTGSAEIEVTARWASRITLFLSDGLVDLDAPLVVRVNGEVVHEGRIERSMRVALEEARHLGDERRVYAARLTVPVPTTRASTERAVQAWEALAPTHPHGQLSFWEMYAVGALEERVPTIGFEGREEPLSEGVSGVPEQMGVRVTAVDPEGPPAEAGLEAGDVLVSFGGEPFFRGRGGVEGLYHWLIRELRDTETDYELVVWREGRLVTLHASYVLGPYRPPDE